MFASIFAFTLVAGHAAELGVAVAIFLIDSFKTYLYLFT